MRQPLCILALLAATAAFAACDSGGGAGPAVADATPTADTPTPDAGAETDGVGGDEPADQLCGERPGGVTWGAHVLRFEATDPATVVQLRREYIDVGVGESALYALRQWGMRLGGETTCVTDAAALGYDNSHHNWLDEAHATVDGVRYDLTISFMPGAEGAWSITLRAVDTASGATAMEALALVPTGGPVGAYGSPHQASLKVHVNEVMAANTATHADEHGEHDPWIEIFNPYYEAVDLEGYTLSNDLLDRDRWPLPAVTIARHGYLVVFADGQPEQGDLHAGFRLAPEGGAVVLTAPDGATDGGVVYGPQEADVSFGFTWEAGGYIPLATPSPGAENAPAQ